MRRGIKELREWLSQFTDNAEVWAYEGEVSAVIVEDEGKEYCFQNGSGEDNKVKE